MEEAKNKFLAAVVGAMTQFTKETGFVVTQIELKADGLEYRILSTEYFKKRMDRTANAQPIQ